MQLLEFEKPIVRDDSIVQRAVYPRLAARAADRQSVVKVETRAFSAGRTVFAVIGSVAAYPALYFLYYATCGCYDQ